MRRLLLSPSGWKSERSTTLADDLSPIISFHFDIKGVLSARGFEDYGLLYMSATLFNEFGSAAGSPLPF
jgi:hypothetical protein